LYPPFERRRNATAASNCPAFKRDSVLERSGGDPARADTVHPGVHRFDGPDGSDGYSVVWWDPSVLDLDCPPATGIRHGELIAKDAPRGVVEETLAAYRTWEDDRRVALERGRVPSVCVMTASEWAVDGRPLPAGLSAGEVAVSSVAGRAAERPSGARFGTLVHAVLGAIALDADDSALRAMTRLQSRVLGATDEEGAAAIEVATETLRHPLVARARAAAERGACRREVPLTFVDDGGTVIEGVADLAFEEQGVWTVVDFKTDVEIGRLGLEEYRRQIAFYASVIARATGQKAQGVLLRI
jgi:hypothetical protein